jgi:FAD binding domain-containing protein/aromatic ring hydroxylase-like protein
MSDMRWSSRFLSERRQARHYRSGRVFLAGDAAHVHSPLGGQGMNTGLGDAINLGWKLAAAVRGQAPPWLLDSYERERHPVGERVLRMTDTFNQIVLGSPLTRRARAFALGAVLRIPRTRRFVAEQLSGIGIAYPHARGEDWLVGRRMADVKCGDTWLYKLLRSGKFVLVTAAPVDVAGCDVEHAIDNRPELPDAVLVRPDGYVAWASERLPRSSEVRAAIAHWTRA